MFSPGSEEEDNVLVRRVDDGGWTNSRVMVTLMDEVRRSVNHVTSLFHNALSPRTRALLTRLAAMFQRRPAAVGAS